MKYPTKPLIPSCPRCGSKKIKKKGTRKTRHDLRQRYGCNICGHTFIKEVTKYSSYPVKLIMEGISFYNLGYSARKTVGYLRRRFGIKVPEQTFRNWYTSHKPICTYHELRDQIKRRLAPVELTKKFYLAHHQVYLFQIHIGKIDLLLSYPYHQTYHRVKEYLAAIQGTDFPHHLFTQDQKDRSSNYPVILNAQVTQRDNYATKLAALALQIAPTNKKRHETLQRFMLLNDSATIAVEVPIYLTMKDFQDLRDQGFTFPFGAQPITGHIDLIQIRSSFVHILDYKPEAKKERHVVTQLTIYALAISQRTGIPIKAIKCAWFDEKDYFEFFPLPLVYPKREHTQDAPMSQASS